MASKSDDNWRKNDGEEGEEDEDEGVKRKFGPRSATDVQRNKLDKLMKNPAKPVHIPEPKSQTPKDPNKKPAEFMYNVMGSSAGAGSGEFHVYRQIRRKETLRMNALGKIKDVEDLNEAYKVKLAENEREAEERTAKKREKRQKKKLAAKKRKEELKKNKKESSSNYH